MKKFYMVFNVTTQGATKQMHGTVTAAREEARRLAIAHTPHRFVVLESQEIYCYEPAVSVERTV